MKPYEDKKKELVQDTKNFLSSEYGQFVMKTLQDMAAGYLVGTTNVSAKYPERYASRYAAIKEVIDFINSPLDDDTLARG